MKNLFIRKIPDSHSLIRSSFSRKSNLSLNRGLKKLIEYNNILKSGDNENCTSTGRIAVKSVWHSYRILKFAMEVGNLSGVLNFSCANDGWKHLLPVFDKINSCTEVSKEELKDFHNLFCKNSGNNLTHNFKQRYEK